MFNGDFFDMLVAVGLENCVNEEGAISLSPSSTTLKRVFWQKLCERCRQTVLDDDIM